MTDCAIETHGLGRRFGKRWAVRDLDLAVPHGAVVGLLGPNGAGKSTTIQMLMGLLPPTEGSARVLGLDPVGDDVAVRSKVGYVAEQHGFYEWMSVDETVGLVSAYHANRAVLTGSAGYRLTYFAGLYSVIVSVSALLTMAGWFELISFLGSRVP